MSRDTKALNLFSPFTANPLSYPSSIPIGTRYGTKKDGKRKRLSFRTNRRLQSFMQLGSGPYMALAASFRDEI
ncbi:hypothetical protein AB6A23_20025 [Paenibacillus tarimensis]